MHQRRGGFMRCVSRRVIVVGGLLACLVGGEAAVAQDKPADKPADNMQLFREKARADKRLVVASVLELTEGEAKAFWPVYNAYQSDMVSHYDRVIKLIETFSKSYNSMTDEMATKLVKEYLALEQNHAKVLTAYAPRFEKVLPPKKVARLYQIENKMRALVNYELANQIPFVK